MLFLGELGICTHADLQYIWGLPYTLQVAEDLVAYLYQRADSKQLLYSFYSWHTSLAVPDDANYDKIMQRPSAIDL